MTTNSQHSKPVRLAAVAYQAALAEKWETARDAVVRISNECGGTGLRTALIAWCDTYQDHATDGGASHASPRMSYINAATGELATEKPANMPDHVWWAGQLVAARAAMDHDRFQELIAAMPADGYAVGRYVFAVLQSVAFTVNGLPRGFARMGRGGAA